MPVLRAGAAVSLTDAERLDQRLHFLGRRLNQAQKQWVPIAEGDRILLGLSGGKDSLTLLRLLLHWRRSAPVDFTLSALHVEIAGAAGNAARRSLLAGEVARIAGDADCDLHFAAAAAPDARGAGHAGDHAGRDLHPCFVCARRRREILFRHAADHGLNKLALAHHLDDAAETVLMNVLFHGRAEGMRPVRAFFADRVTLIRPLILAEEKEIRRVSALVDFPYFGCFCDAEPDSRRRQVKAFLASLGRQATAAKRHLWRLSQDDEPM